MWRRDWIIMKWWTAIIAACEVVDIKPHLIFLGDPADVETQRAISIIEDFAVKGGRQRVHRAWMEQPPHRARDDLGQTRARSWQRQDIEFMVELRNRLLKEVRWLEPDLFWSVDSDILVHPEALKCSLETLQVGRRDRQDLGFDAVASRTYLDRILPINPNYANRTRNDNFYRPDWHGVGGVDVIMALKLMKPDAYFVDYRYHEWGEDIGWSDACRERGLHLAFDGRTYSRHVYGPEFLEREDKRA